MRPRGQINLLLELREVQTMMFDRIITGLFLASEIITKLPGEVELGTGFIRHACVMLQGCSAVQLFHPDVLCGWRRL